jgi:2,3-bisphosphoglycerate-independent phosphoglycerate mutase
LSSEKKGNAIANAHTPNMTSLSRDFLHTKLDASGLSVGLPAGVMGNSEVGHLTMGAGRVDFQDLVRINQAIEQGDFAKNDTLQLAIRRAKAGNGRVHLLGLVSDGAVHSHIQHLFRFLEALKAGGVPQAYVHVFADGRDTPPTTAVKYIKDLQDFMTQQLGGYGRIASVQGRYFAMDRDKRWERVQIAYEALIAAKGDKVEQVAEDKLLELVQKRYDAGEKDEFLRPIIVQQTGSVAPLDGLIADADTLIFINFRSDRMREITSIFAKMTEEIPSAADASLPFPQEVARRKNLMVVGMTKYDEKVVLPTLFPPQTMTNVLPEWISRHNLSQFHTAETEKYAHVTFFFAGGQEASFPLEERALIPSPSVATYDLAPEMSQEAVGASVLQAIESGRFPFIMTNLAAPDMVGHTGHYDKAVIACTKCDEVIGTIWEACKKNKSVWMNNRTAHARTARTQDSSKQSFAHLCVACLLCVGLSFRCCCSSYILVVTADHGNAEEMYASDGESPKTSHTTNLIPLIVAAPDSASGLPLKWKPEVEATNNDEKKNGGGLSDVAPTVLALMGLAVPKEMTGKPLLTLSN